MLFDQQEQAVGGGAVEAEALGDCKGNFCADIGMIAGMESLAGIMEEEREVEQEGTLDLLEELAVMIEGGITGFPDFIQLLNAHQRVFIGSVLMIKLVLDEAG